MADPDYVEWNEKTFDLIEAYSRVFEDVALALAEMAPEAKISAQALAGAMAKENSAVQRDPEREEWKDNLALSQMMTDWICWCEFYAAKEAGIIDRPLLGAKRLYYVQKGLGVMMDLGPFNTQGAQALRVLEDYLSVYRGTSEDPLGLKPYDGKCTEFLRALSGLMGKGEGIRVAAAVWGLLLVEASEWFLEKICGDAISERWWNSLRQEQRDALYAQWCFCGRARMEELYAKNKADNGGHYMPEPVKRDSGAWNVYNNSGRVGDSTGDPAYGINHGPGIPDNGQWQEEEEEEEIDFEGLTCSRDPDPRDPWERAAASGAIPRRDPLILDLDGDGFETTTIADGTFFDHDGDGFAEQTGWVDGDDGLLVLDRNGDGIINDGKELFGNGTPLANGSLAGNGFQALADLDSNGDGKIDAADPGFSQLRIWKDTNEDGFSSSYELHTLDDLGIIAINLTSTPESTTDTQGNTRTRLGNFEWADGTAGQIAEYSLQRDTMNTISTDWVEVPVEIWALPVLPGYGKVDTLTQSMVKDTSGQLKSLVEQFISATGPVTWDALNEQILFKRTGSENIDPTSRGPN
ncbi:MAG: hypothetical protein AB1733_24775, partial [Thermodesulfobacteriota bacterium]